MSDQEFASVGQDSAQYSMMRLMELFGITRADVTDIGRAPGRNRLGELVMAPMRHWRNPGLDVRHISMLATKTDWLEARAVAVATRDAMEKGELVHIITPSRKIAKMIKAELLTFGITPNDTAGVPASETGLGNLAMLILKAAMANWPTMELLAVLKHPMTRWEFRVAERVEKDIRGQVGIDNLDLIIGRSHVSALSLVPRFKPEPGRLADLFVAHMEMVRAMADLSRMDELSQRTLEAFDNIGAEFADLPPGIDIVMPSVYASIMATELFRRSMRAVDKGEPKVVMLNSIEARLLSADLVIMPGMNQGTFPIHPPPDPWMNRSMRREFGIPLPERKTGLMAHDFAEFSSSRKVLLTRAMSVGGETQVPSRWWQKAEAILALNNLAPNTEYSDYIVGVMKGFYDAGEAQPCKRPSPRPPVHARPKKLSVTSIEKWYRDPYIIYADKILGLRRLDDLVKSVSPADFGNVVHASLEEYKRRGLSSADELLEEMMRRAADLMSIDTFDFWQDKFRKIARYFVEFERSLPTHESIIEAVGEMKITDDFTIQARADRIDLRSDGEAAIYDYKTGSAPSKRDVSAGFSPQLPLEAAIFSAGGFGPAARASRLCYIELAKEKAVWFDDAEQLARDALEKLETVARKFENERTPYLSRPNAAKVGRAIEEYSEYAHLARVSEWDSK